LLHQGIFPEDATWAVPDLLRVQRAPHRFVEDAEVVAKSEAMR
jgi:hypothetical protein